MAEGQDQAELHGQDTGRPPASQDRHRDQLVGDPGGRIRLGAKPIVRVSDWDIERIDKGSTLSVMRVDPRTFGASRSIAAAAADIIAALRYSPVRKSYSKTGSRRRGR